MLNVESPRGGKRYRGAKEKAAMLVAKTRAIGIDTDELDRMVAEQRALEEVENAEDKLEADTWKKINLIQTADNDADLKLKYEKDAELRDEWQYQRRSPRIERDLDPRHNKRTPINPDVCCVGAAQSFAGEDPSYAQRQMHQKQQMREWCLKDAAEKAAIKADNSEELKEKQTTETIGKMLQEADFESREDQQARLYEVQQYNRLVAKEKKLAKKKETLLNQSINNWEIQNAYNDPNLAEDPCMTGAAARFRSDHYKGMSHAEVAEIYAFNATQAEEIQQAKQAEKDEDKEWASYYSETNKGIFKMEQENALEETLDTYARAKELRIQAKEHHKEQKMLHKEIGMNRLDPEFYDSFGRSA